MMTSATEIMQDRKAGWLVSKELKRDEGKDVAQFETPFQHLPGHPEETTGILR
jgi:hypothetical protein